MKMSRWMVALGALLIAALAFYSLTTVGGSGDAKQRKATSSTPTMDEIDADSRKAMRDLLRDAEE